MDVDFPHRCFRMLVGSRCPHPPHLLGRRNSGDLHRIEANVRPVGLVFIALLDAVCPVLHPYGIRLLDAEGLLQATSGEWQITLMTRMKINNRRYLRNRRMKNKSRHSPLKRALLTT